PRPAVQSIFQLADFVFVNHREFKLMGSAAIGDTHAEIGRKTLERCGSSTSVVVFDRYDRIEIYRTRDGDTESETFRPSASFTYIEESTGAGDLFAAGFVGALVSPSLKWSVGSFFGAELAQTKLGKARRLEDSELQSVSMQTVAKLNVVFEGDDEIDLAKAA